LIGRRRAAAGTHQGGDESLLPRSRAGLGQNSQNRDSAAIQVKLDELIRVSAVHNSFVGIEHLTDDELDEIRTRCERRAEAEKAGEKIVKSARKKAKRAVDLVTE
jgi:low affinity Fe/Cu permease